MVALTVKRTFELAAARNHRKPALTCGGKIWSYADVDAGANRLANHLAGAGLQAGEHVVIVMNNGAEYVVAAIACAKGRFVMVAMNYRYIVDRKKDVIKSGGVNVFPVEIEEVLLEHTDVGDVAVIGVADDRWGEAVHAVIVPQPGTQISATTLSAHCRVSLAGYKVPKSFEFRNALPRNANGKILKRQLRQEFTKPA